MTHFYFHFSVLSSFQPNGTGDHPKPAYKHSSSKIVEGLSHPLRYFNKLFYETRTIYNSLTSFKSWFNYVISSQILSNRINPSNVPASLHHVTPVRRIPNHYQRLNHGSRAAKSSPSAVEVDTGRREANDETLESQSDDTKVLKRQLETEREKVRQLSSQLTTNVRIHHLLSVYSFHKFLLDKVTLIMINHW